MRAAVLVLALAALLLPPRDVRAAPETPHFRFVPEAGTEGLADHLAETAEEKRRYVVALLGIADERVLEVRIAATQEGMSRMVGTARPVRDWIAGMAMSDRDLIVMSARGNEVFKASDTFVHELAHVYLDSALEGRSVPRWFHEGFAMLVSSEEMGERLKAVLNASATGSLFPLDELTDGFPAEGAAVHLAYAQSLFFVRWINRAEGGTGVRTLLREVRNGMPFDLAFEQVVGSSVAQGWKRFARTLDPMRAWLFVLTGTGVIWGLILLLFLFVYWRKRRRSELRKEAWELEDRISAQAWAHPPDEVN